MNHKCLLSVCVAAFIFQSQAFAGRNEFYNAVKNGRLSEAASLLEKGEAVDIDWSPASGRHAGRSATYWAAFNGDYEMLRLLLTHKPSARVDFAQQNGEYANVNAVWFALDASFKQPQLPWINLIRIMLEHNPGVQLNLAPKEGQHWGTNALSLLRHEINKMTAQEDWQNVLFLLRFSPSDIEPFMLRLKREAGLFVLTPAAEWFDPNFGAPLTWFQCKVVPRHVLKAFLLCAIATGTPWTEYRDAQLTAYRVELERLLVKMADIFFDENSPALNRDMKTRLAIETLRLEDPDLTLLDAGFIVRALRRFEDPLELRIRRTGRWIGAAVTLAIFPVANRLHDDNDLAIRIQTIHARIFTAFKRLYTVARAETLFGERFRQRAVGFIVAGQEEGLRRRGIAEALDRANGEEPVPVVPAGGEPPEKRHRPDHELELVDVPPVEVVISPWAAETEEIHRLYGPDIIDFGSASGTMPF